MKIFLAALFVITLTGCIPIQQMTQVSGPKHPDVSLYDRCLGTDFSLKQEKINSEQSYIESPAGKHFTIQARPYQTNAAEKYVVQTLLFLFAADGSPLSGWRNGIWSYHFVVESNGVTQVFDQKWKYYTFYYNPIIHGLPN